MKTIFLVSIVFFLALFFINKQDSCSFAAVFGDSGPKRLVIIQGKATIMNHPDLGVTPATSETIIFQKVGCNSCYIGTHTDIDGNYKITVGDGKYKVIVRNPSSPEFDMLSVGQERFIDTETKEAEQFSKQVFNFDVRITFPK